MSNRVWTALAENFELQVANNQRVIEGHLVKRIRPGARPEDLSDPLIENLRNTNAQLRRLAADARSRIH